MNGACTTASSDGRLRPAGFTAIIAALAAVSLLAGCASPKYRRADFARDRERCVGRTFGDPASWWCGWDHAVDSQAIDTLMEEYTIAPPGMGECRWIYRVDRVQRVVTGWRYAAGRDDCKTAIDWLGAW